MVCTCSLGFTYREAGAPSASRISDATRALNSPLRPTCTSSSDSRSAAIPSCFLSKLGVVFGCALSPGPHTFALVVPARRLSEQRLKVGLAHSARLALAAPLEARIAACATHVTARKGAGADCGEPPKLGVHTIEEVARNAAPRVICLPTDLAHARLLLVEPRARVRCQVRGEVAIVQVAARLEGASLPRCIERACGVGQDARVARLVIVLRLVQGNAAGPLVEDIK
eukprot:scaffold306_cov525-Prasinococcus_capsulatus_cf.AAC.31